MESQQLTDISRRAAKNAPTVLRRAAKWAAAVLAVSLVLPAATKQWSDNQQQRQLKTEVTSALAAAVSEATTNGGFLLADRIEKKRSGKDDKDLRAAYQDTMVTWKREAAAIDGQIVGYFAKTSDPGDDALVKAMRAYDQVVQNYLGYCLLFRQSSDRYLRGVEDKDIPGFKGNLAKMQMQTGDPRLSFTTVVPELVRSYVSGAEPDDMDPFREAAQNDWAKNIVNAKAPLITMVRKRQPNGLEVGPGAFIRQIVPFV
jgi:hypothetical protein